MSRTEWVGPGDPPYTPESILRKDVPEAVLKHRVFQSSSLFSRWLGPSDERSYVLFWFGNHNPVCLYNEKHGKWFVNISMCRGMHPFHRSAVEMFDPSCLPDATYIDAKELSRLANMGLMGFLENQVNEENHK